MIRTFVVAILASSPAAILPSLAADIPRDISSFGGCLPNGAVTSLLPAQGYSNVKRLGEQKGATYFDAMLGSNWYRIAINSCSAVVVTRQREKAPL